MSLKKPLTAETICLNLQGTTKDEVLAEMVDLLMASGHIRDRDAVLRAITERERRMSTGMQNGIAIPHGKTDSVDCLPPWVSSAVASISARSTASPPTSSS